MCHKFNKQDDNALEAAVFVKEVLERHSEYRKDAEESIRNNLYEIKSPKALRVLIWCLGEYSESEDDLNKAYNVLMENIGQIPLTISSKDKVSNTKAGTQQPEETKQKVITKTVILADGSYGTETIVVDERKHTNQDEIHDLNTRYPLREFIESEEFFLWGVLSITLWKIIIKLKQKLNKNFKKMSIDSLIFFCSYLRIHQSNKKFDPDNKNRIAFWVKVLSDINKTPVLVLDKIVSGEGRKILSSIIERKIEQIEQRKIRKHDKALISNAVDPDELIQYRQFREQEQGETGFQFDIESDSTMDYDFSNQKKSKEEGEIRHYQLTGLSDAIYVEAKLEIFQHNLNLTLLVVNRTKNTLPSVNVTLLTLGSIKLVSKLPTINLKGYSSETMHASLKVFNTENGGIYGYINYEAVNPVSIPLDGIEIDFMDSLHPGYCTEVEFKKMWADYEWENKITVNTTITDTAANKIYYQKKIITHNNF